MSEICHNEWRQKTRSGRRGVHHGVQCAGKVGRQIVRIRVGRQRYGAVESKRNGDERDAGIWVVADIWNGQQEQAGNDVRCV